VPGGDDAALGALFPAYGGKIFLLLIGTTGAEDKDNLALHMFETHGSAAPVSPCLWALTAVCAVVFYKRYGMMRYGRLGEQDASLPHNARLGVQVA